MSSNPTLVPTPTSNPTTTAPSLTITTAATTTVYVTVPASSQPSIITTSTSLPTFVFSTHSSSVSQTHTAPIPTATIIEYIPITSSTTSSSSSLSHTGGIQHPNNEQIRTIWVAAIMLLCISVGWNMILIRSILHPWKMLINLIHESGHIFVAILTGANVYSITIDPDKGPISGMTGGQPHLILSAGYFTSILIGSGIIMTSFDTSASKIASLTLFPLFVVCFWFGRTWARIRLLGCIGLSVGFWFIDKAAYLRYYMLFIGVMCAFYVVWDALDDFLFRKENESDAALFARMSGPTSQAWVLIWLVITLGFVSLGVIGGLYFFDKSAEAQRQAQHAFLPT